MDKLLTFQTQTDRGVFLYTVGEGRDQQFLEKTASSSFHPEVSAYITNAAKMAGKTQLLLTALGAGEYYGSNVNGDYFPETPLKNPTPEYGYKTFERMAKVYKHHVNKDPKKSYGDVALSVWNDKMKRVELIVIIDDAKAPDIVDRINNGEYPEVSMGCRVPYDVCSICGNKAKTRAQYCDHLRYHMNKIPPGYTKKAYALNTIPRFFDISFVLVGADRIASVMKKVAHMHPLHGVSSAEQAEASSKEMHKLAFGLDGQKVASKKFAAMTKKIPSNLDGSTAGVVDQLGLEGAEALQPLEPKIPKIVIIKITRGPSGMGNVNSALSTLAMMGIVPKKEEFQSIVLRGLGKHNYADSLERKGQCFNPCGEISPIQRISCDRSLDISPDHFSDTSMKHLLPFMEDRSYSKPILSKRVIRLVKLAESGKLEYPIEDMNKHAEDSDDRAPMSPTVLMTALTGLYLAMGKKAPRAAQEEAGNLIFRHPALALALGVGAIAAGNELIKDNVAGKYDFNPHKGPLVDDVNMSWQDQIRLKNKNPLSKMASVKNYSRNVGLSLFAGVPLTYMYHGTRKVKKARNPNAEEGLIDKAFRKYPDVIGGGVATHAIMGSPITNKIKGSLGFLKKVAEEKSKSPRFGKELLSTAAFSLAFPGKSLVGRLASNSIDQGIISGVGKLLERKHGN